MLQGAPSLSGAADKDGDFRDAPSSQPLSNILQRDSLAGSLRARSRQRNPQRSHRIVNRNGGLAIFMEVVDEILKLRGVRVAESLHEKGNGVVRDLILGHHEQRRFPEISDAQRACGAEDFAEDVVAIDAAAAEIDHANADRKSTRLNSSHLG